MNNFMTTYSDSLDLGLYLQNNIFLKALSELVDLDTLDIRFTNGTLWFSLLEVEDKMDLNVLPETFDSFRRCFMTLLHGEYIPVKGRIYRNSTQKFWVSERFLLYYMFFLKNEAASDFRWEYAYHILGDYPEDAEHIIIKLPEMIRNNPTFVDMWIASIISLETVLK